MSVFNLSLCLAQTTEGICSLFYFLFFLITQVQVNMREKENVLVPHHVKVF